MKKKDHDPVTGRRTGKAEIDYLKKQGELADRIVRDRSFEGAQAKRDSAYKLATERYDEFAGALHEHLSEAQREGNTLMTALYASVLNGLLNAGTRNIDENGKLKVTIDLARREW